jgi:hypothetical protein
MSDTKWAFKFTDAEAETLIEVLGHAYDNLNKQWAGDSFDCLARRVAKDKVKALLDEIMGICR